MLSKYSIRIVAAVFLGLSAASAAYTQPKPSEKTAKRPTEKEVMLEQTYINATRERILGNYDAAITLYQEVLQKDSENAAASYELARLYELKKQLDEAITRAERAYILDKKNLFYAEYLAKLLEKKGEYKQAAELYAKLVDILPDEPNLYLSWAYFLVKSGKQDQAIKVYNQLEGRVGVQIELSSRKYQLYLGLNKLKPAEKELQNLTKALPNDGEAWLLLARHYKNTKQTPSAHAAYNKVLDIMPNNSEANIELASSVLASGDELSYLRTMLVVFDSPDHSVADKNMILQPFVSKTISSATAPNAEYMSALLALTEKNALRSPDSYEAQYMQAQILEYTGQFALALDAYRSAIALHKNNMALWEAALGLGVCMGDMKANAGYTDMFLELYPNNPQPYYYQALTLTSQKKYKEASELLAQALPMAGALPDYEALLKSQQSIVWAAQGNKEKSTQAYTKAAEMFNQIAPTAANPQLLAWQWGLMSFAKADFGGCKSQLQKQLTAAKVRPALYELFGDAAAKLGNNSESLEYWQKAEKSGSRSATLTRKISEKIWIED
jgi:tetratricopeptide (TPR) repeat protein